MHEHPLKQRRPSSDDMSCKRTNCDGQKPFQWLQRRLQSLHIQYRLPVVQLQYTKQGGFGVRFPSQMTERKITINTKLLGSKSQTRMLKRSETEMARFGYIAASGHHGVILLNKILRKK